MNIVPSFPIVALVSIILPDVRIDKERAIHQLTTISDIKQMTYGDDKPVDWQFSVAKTTLGLMPPEELDSTFQYCQYSLLDSPTKFSEHFDECVVISLMKAMTMFDKFEQAMPHNRRNPLWPHFAAMQIRRAIPRDWLDVLHMYCEDGNTKSGMYKDQCKVVEALKELQVEDDRAPLRSAEASQEPMQCPGGTATGGLTVIPAPACVFTTVIPALALFYVPIAPYHPSSADVAAEHVRQIDRQINSMYGENTRRPNDWVHRVASMCGYIPSLDVVFQFCKYHIVQLNEMDRVSACEVVSLMKALDMLTTLRDEIPLRGYNAAYQEALVDLSNEWIHILNKYCREDAHIMMIQGGMYQDACAIISRLNGAQAGPSKKRMKGQ